MPKKADETYGTGPYGKPLFRYPELRELMLVKGQINTRSFGQFLTNNKSRIRDAWRIRISNEKGKSNIYMLEYKAEWELKDAPEAEGV